MYPPQGFKNSTWHFTPVNFHIKFSKVILIWLLFSMYDNRNCYVKIAFETCAKYWHMGLSMITICLGDLMF